MVVVKRSACLPQFLQSEFESCWSRQFFCKICVWKERKRGRDWPTLKNFWLRLLSLTFLKNPDFLEINVYNIVHSLLFVCCKLARCSFTSSDALWIWAKNIPDQFCWFRRFCCKINECPLNTSPPDKSCIIHKLATVLSSLYRVQCDQ